MSEIEDEPVVDSPAGETDSLAEPPPIPSRKRDWHIPERSLAAGYTSLAVVGGILFFLPWVQLSCTTGEMTVVGYTQTGEQIATGELKRSETLKDWQTNLQALQSLRAKAREGAASPRELDSYERKCDGFIGLWAFPIGLGLVVLSGLIHAVFLPAARPMVAIIGSAAAVLAVAACLVVELPISREVESRISTRYRQRPDYDDYRQRFQVERLPAFTASLWVSGSLCALVLAHYGVATWKRRG